MKTACFDNKTIDIASCENIQDDSTECVSNTISHISSAMDVATFCICVSMLIIVLIKIILGTSFTDMHIGATIHQTWTAIKECVFAIIDLF